MGVDQSDHEAPRTSASTTPKPPPGLLPASEEPGWDRPGQDDSIEDRKFGYGVHFLVKLCRIRNLPDDRVWFHSFYHGLDEPAKGYATGCSG